ncbi:MAG: Na+/H+ antiporter NhaA, partial [Opitutaceae bacterium]|nr:Na+/H+ antiporter NhaA [Verrucomicrobiales bacterium]
MTLTHIHGASWLGGIGFTMSIFVAELAFKDSALLNMAKIGILTASILAGMAGSILLFRKSATTTQDNQRAPRCPEGPPFAPAVLTRHGRTLAT